ncbi:MAG: NAD-dependent epimerase/dehydratase family protein [Myxococcota bacterium]
MKVFITGATGAVGSCVARELAEHGHEILALVRGSASERIVESLGYTPIRGDMTEPSPWITAAARADVLIHAAWTRPGSRMDGDWLRIAMAADEAAIGGLIRASQQGDSALVLTSGHSVFGDHGDTWIDEETPCSPAVGSMGLKQLATEVAAKQAAAAGVPTVVLRPCTVYGASSPSMDYFFGSASQHVMQYPGNGNNYFPFVHEADVAMAYRLAVEQMPAGEVIALGDDEPMRLREVASLLLDEFGGGQQVGAPKWLVAGVAGIPFADIMTASCRVRNTKAKRVLGWKPRYPTLRGGVKNAIERWRAAGGAA